VTQMITNFSYFPLIFKAIKTIRHIALGKKGNVNVAKFHLNCKKILGLGAL